MELDRELGLQERPGQGPQRQERQERRQPPRERREREKEQQSGQEEVLEHLPGVERESVAEKRDPERPCLLYTSPSPRDGLLSRMPSSA